MVLEVPAGLACTTSRRLGNAVAATTETFCIWRIEVWRLAIIVFATSRVIRLTNLGIRGVGAEIVQTTRPLAP